MYCVKCGSSIPENFRFCDRCGTPINGTTQINGQQSDVQTSYPQQQFSTAPVGQLTKKRNIAKLIIFTILTLGIYPIVVLSGISNDINVIASRYDGKKTMHYCLLFFLVGPLTLEIGTLVWNHKLANRVGDELKRRGIDYYISAKTYWLWSILGIFIAVGPWIYLHKLFKAMNLLCDNYNING